MGKKILIVEDEPDQVAMIKMRLEASGFEVISASDGEEGLNKAYSENPDLVLLDIIMPNKDGYEVCRSLKADSRSSSIPVLMISATGIKDAQQKSFACGADGFIKKPYDSKELLKKIESLI